VPWGPRPHSKGGRMQQTAVACPVSARYPTSLRLRPTLRRCTFTLHTILSYLRPPTSPLYSPCPPLHRVVSDVLHPVSRPASRVSPPPLQRLATSGSLSVVCSALQGECSPRCTLRCALCPCTLCYAALAHALTSSGSLSVVCSALQADHTLAVYPFDCYYFERLSSSLLQWFRVRLHPPS
jgi:hypothetical protein